MGATVGRQRLRKALEPIKTSTSLKLNMIEDEGATTFAKALETNKTRASFNLVLNRIEGDFNKILGKENKSGEPIDLTLTGINI
ncbi:hypothetical protein BC936DRAFT_145454 [Jimgerdemannia flammicorona]|uniref:Uncharacterized protein n=1 Tax=Jimgerdemannia flammicorona TaxID=994334 RepID=A0A433DA14_9FUNG|nr:hypothetical protein BC936DRAFT_145454 [Jimgerdemannia flammicorona]